jgi:transposase
MVNLGAEERRRVQVLTRVLLGSLTADQAASQLGLSVRQVARLKATLARDGPTGLAHGNRGRRPARRLPDELRARLVQLATQVYPDLPHSQLQATLAEREGITIARSTLRRVLLEAGVRSPQQRRRRLPAGVVPISFNIATRRVELIDLKGADFREPFFHQTVERWRRERRSKLHLELDLEVFLQAARTEPGRPPAGFVFHAGRCGSTLLANMLSAPPQYLVIKESPAVNRLMEALLNAADATLRREREDLVELALPFMFRPTRGTEQQLFFKLSSWNVRLADTLLWLFPATPAVFVYRAAAPTVASMLAEPPGWQHLLTRPRAIQARFFPSVANVPAQVALSSTAFYAHAWRSAAEAALGLPPERLLMLEYGELVSAPDLALRRLLMHFGLQPQPDQLELMLQVQGVYSKDPGGRTSFDPSGAHRRGGLDTAQELEVQTIVGSLEQRMAERQWSEGGLAQPLSV